MSSVCGPSFPIICLYLSIVSPFTALPLHSNMCRQINTPVIGPETWLSTMGKRQMSSATGFYNYSIGPIGVSSLQKYIQYNVCELQ